MRLIKQNIEKKDGSGSATLLPEEPEDMVGWFLCSYFNQQPQGQKNKLSAKRTMYL